jgi:comEA protein
MKTACVSLVIAGLLAGGAASAAGQTDTGQATKTAVTAPINLNTATPAELESLPGVGPALAARIAEHRQKNGPFKKVEDLMTIKGIGEKQFLKLKPLVTVAPAKPAERVVGKDGRPLASSFRP